MSKFSKAVHGISYLIPAAALVLLSSCITPPPPAEPSVLPKEELEIISRISEGKDFALMGRAELAEKEIRLALERRPELDYLYNDLGYVLYAQDRPKEAETAFREALKREPRNIAARGNLAKLLYQEGRYEEALQQLEQSIDVLNSYAFSELSQILGIPIAGDRFPMLYRAMAMIYYARGEYDEAVCYSWLAQLTAGTIVQAGQHSRLLLSLGKTQAARDTIQGVLTVHKGRVPPGMLVDYAMLLYLDKQNALARTALARVLQSQALDPSVRRTARLLRLLVALESENEEEAKEVYFTLQDDDPKLCEEEERPKILDPDSYWPPRVTDAFENLLDKMCNDEEQPLFES